MSRPLRVLILGHSFIRRLDRFLTEKHSAEHNLSLSRSTHHVRLEGISGGHIDDLPTLFHVHERFSPVVVLIDISTNDIADNRVNLQTLALNLINHARRLHTQYQAASIILCEVLPRGFTGKFKGSPDFNIRVARLNSMLKTLVRQHKPEHPLLFWYHKGIVADVEEFPSDGCHLNDQGLSKYATSLRSAVIRVSNKVRNGRSTPL